MDIRMTTNLYKVLGVKKSDAQDDIKKAYRKLTKKLHPDLNPGDKNAEERFKAVSAAYDILGKPEQRTKYDSGEIDESGAEKPQQQYYRQYADSDRAHQYQNNAGYGDMGDMGGVFEQMFRRQQQAQAQQAYRGQDRRYTMRVSFMDAVLGGKQQVQMADGANLNVAIPKGIEDGKTIRLKGKGEAGYNGAPSGDALIQIEITPHSAYSRDGMNIALTLPITVYEAALGGKVEVPTIHGAVGLNIPAGSSSGKTLRLKGRGIHGKTKGDQMVTLSVQMPDTIEDDVANMLKDWQKNHAYDPRAKLKGATNV